MVISFESLVDLSASIYYQIYYSQLLVPFIGIGLGVPCPANAGY